MRSIYVIRYSSCVDDEFECGNFEVAETDEAVAVAHMLADMDSAKKDNDDGVDEVKTHIQIANEHVESCSLEVIHAGSGDVDTYNWWIDKIELDLDS